MEESILECETTKGMKSFVLNTSADSVKLSKMNITDLSLDSFTHFSKLQRLWINSNKLETIDLSPLSHCSSLEFLDVSGNELKSIDLSPLRHCVQLKELYLHQNSIETIDLEPLPPLKKLRKLFLDRNRLKRVYLDPLFDCNYLQEIRLWKNLMPSIDVTPLFFLPNFKALYFEEDKTLTMDMTLRYLSERMGTNPYLSRELKFNKIDWQDYTTLSIRSGWSGVRNRLLKIIDSVDPIYSAAVAEGFFEVFGLPVRQNWDIEIRDGILSIPENSSYGEAVEIIEQLFTSH